ncbi:MAG: hypothetical protein ACJAT1_001721 [Marivirga sp.]|jgi:hypothetical protein
MSRLLKFIFIIFFVSGAINLYGQVDYQQEYLAAKVNFRLGNYQAAKVGFGKLLELNEQNPFALYANYYYAIATYQLGDTTEALVPLRRVWLTHDQWKNRDDLGLWYGKLLLEDGQLLKGIEVFNEIETPNLKAARYAIELQSLQVYDNVSALKEALELNPYDSVLAAHLAFQINKLPIIDRPVALQEFLIESFQLDRELIGVVNKEVSQIKNTYNVGVMMPFMAHDLTTVKGNKGNQFVLDIYQAIQVAASELNEQGRKQIKLFAFDTKRDSAVTAEIINSGDLLQMDLVIGPLYPKPAMLMKEYSKEYRLNMVNPLSTNSTIIGENPYSFLLKSTAQTRARKAAKYAAENYENKVATIFYGKSEEDSLFAYSYKKYLEADSFNVKWIAPVRSALASSEVLKSLTEVFDADTLNYGKVYIANLKKVRVNDGDSLIMSRDSIGHIMVATEDDKLLVFNVLSAVETRRDSVPVIGMESWVDFDQISYEQIERLGIVLVGQNFFDFTSEELAAFKSKYKDTYNILPSQFSYSGYETMRFFGQQLFDYGNYFQYGLYDKGFQKGYLYTGFDYTKSNDNQFVPLLKLVDLDFIILPAVQQEIID